MTHNVRALCRCGIRIPSAQNQSPTFDKDKCLEPMFGDVGQARTNAAMLLLPIATTSSRTCTKPTVVRSLFYLSIISFANITKSDSVLNVVLGILDDLNITALQDLS